jgi:16S rRNA (guanine527-N7)-methyltransferase
MPHGPSVTPAMPGNAAAAAAPAPPAAAAAAFGPALGLAERYAALLTGPAVERGLLGPAEAPRLWERHLLNCAAVAALVPSPCSLIDLGSGAGLPGIVLAMLLPDVTVTLLEPMARRAVFLDECVRILGLGNAEVRRGRAEEVAGRLSADVVTARAVAPMYKLAGLAIALANPGGMVLAIKGAGAAAELSRARPVLRQLGARDVEVLHAGGDRVNPAATVIRFTVGQVPRGRQRPGPPGAEGLNQRAQGMAGSGSGQPRGARRPGGRGRRGRG